MRRARDIMAGENVTSPAVDLKFYVFEEPYGFIWVYIGWIRVWQAKWYIDHDSHQRRSKVIVPTGPVVPGVSDENSFYSFVFPTQTVFRRLSRIIDLFWTQIGSHFDANQKEQ